MAVGDGRGGSSEGLVIGTKEDMLIEVDEGGERGAEDEDEVEVEGDDEDEDGVEGDLARAGDKADPGVPAL